MLDVYKEAIDLKQPSKSKASKSKTIFDVEEKEVLGLEGSVA